MLRHALVTALLLGSFLTLLTLMVWRAVEMKTTLVADVASGDLGNLRSERTIEPPSGPMMPVSPPPARPARSPLLLDRPLSVIGLGWEALAPALVANAGKTPSKASAFAPSGLAVSITPVADIQSIGASLARGGGSTKGADVAVVPLPRWLADFDGLVAIDPVVFYVAGWSHGREVVVPGASAHAEESHETVPLRLGFEDIDAAYLALFAFRAMGVASGDMVLGAPDADPAPAWLAVDVTDLHVSSPTGIRPSVRWSTAEASELIPVVMVASRPWLKAHTEALAAWLRGWSFGVEEVSGRIAEAARGLGAIEGAPQPLLLMQAMDRWRPCSLERNLALFELGGPEVQPLRSRMRTAWRILHASRLAGAPPAQMPLTGRVLEATLRSRLPSDHAEGLPWTASASPGFRDREGGGERVLLDRPLDPIDGYQLARQIAALRGAFPSAVVRLTPGKDREDMQASFELARDLSMGSGSVEIAAPNPDLPSPGTLQLLLAP